MPFHSESVTVDVAPSGAVSVVGIGVSLSARPDAILGRFGLLLYFCGTDVQAELVCASAVRRVALSGSLRLRNGPSARPWITWSRDRPRDVDVSDVLARRFQRGFRKCTKVLTFATF